MIDLTPIKPWIVEPDEVDIQSAISVIRIVGFDAWFEKQIKGFCNCTLSNNGYRFMQTNDKRYNYEISTTIKMIEEYAEDKDYYYNELINCHFNNLEYERINGFEYDPYAPNKKKSTSRKKSKQTSIDFGDKPKKETAAERKLKAHAAKISMLKFNIKPTNANNSI